MKHAVFALALAASAGRLVQIGPVAGDGAALATLEDALAAQPDDLRAGNDYRMAVIQASQYDRAIAFFDRLVKTHPNYHNFRTEEGWAFAQKRDTKDINTPAGQREIVTEQIVRVERIQVGLGEFLMRVVNKLRGK